jgi:uncharacterized protein (TIGR02271 family)
MTHTVVGLFKDRSEAQAAMKDLMISGFIKEDIDLSNRKFAENTNAGDNYSTDNDNLGIGDRIANFFNSLFGDDEMTARNYTNAASDADAILTVQADSDERARVAQQIFDRHGSMDVDENEARFSQQRTAAAGTKQTNAAAANTKTTIPVVEEKLNVGKQQIETGGARIRSRIVEKPVEANVRLREEHVVVNRRPVDREISDADLKSFKPGEMEITEHAEVPVVGKQARVVEEVEVGKNITERNETVRDTVRSTDVDVNEFDKDVDKAKARKANP